MLRWMEGEGGRRVFIEHRGGGGITLSLILSRLVVITMLYSLRLGRRKGGEQGGESKMRGASGQVTRGEGVGASILKSLHAERSCFPFMCLLRK